MLIHTISIYSWPVSLLKQIEKWIKNFIWSGDVNKRKMVTVAWKKVCSNYEEGGLGTKSLICLNEAYNLKLCLEMMQKDEQWAIVLRSRVMRDSNCINHHIFSSIWSSLKNDYHIIKDNSTWWLGDGDKIQFWRDSWCGAALMNVFNIDQSITEQFPPTVNMYILNNHWNISEELENQFPGLRSIVSQVTIPEILKPDKLVWLHNSTGILTAKEAYDYKKNHFRKLHWTKHIWSADIPPSKSLMVWRLMHNKLPTDENLITRGCHLPSRCSLCSIHEESTFHLFFQCSYAIRLWCWLASMFNFPLHFQHIEDIWTVCDKPWNPQCKLVVTSALINLINSIWYARNQL